MAESYSVRIAKEQLTFSAAHFITYGDNVCEPLHGHNYGLSVEVAGRLGKHEYVVDFIALRDALQKIVIQLDHHVLLPTAHPKIEVVEENDEVIATFERRRWVFPRSDCVLLPVANTTAELVARHIGQQLLQALASQLSFTPDRLEVAVDECAGQWGVWSYSTS